MGSLISLRLKQVVKAARLLCLFRALSYLPLPVAYKFATFIGHLDVWRKNSYLDAIASGMSFIETERFSLSEAKIRKYVARHSEMMAREMLDSHLISGRNISVIERIASLNGTSLVRTKLGGGNGLIILVCHYSRLNMVACSLGYAGIPTGIITQCVDRRNELLDWVDRFYLSGKLRRYHAVTKGTLVTLEDNLRPIYKALLRNEAVIVLMDAYHPRFRKFTAHPFLGGILRIPTGALRLAERTGAPMVYGVVKEKDFKVDVHIRDLPLTGEEALGAAVSELEADVMERPWEWWQWFNIREIWNTGD